MSQAIPLILASLKKYKKYYFFGFLTLVSVDLLEVVPPLLLKKMIDLVRVRDSDAIRVAFLYLGTLLTQSFFRYAWRFFFIRTSHFAGLDIRNRWIDKLFEHPISWIQKTSVGTWVSRYTTDIEAVRLFLGPGFLLILDAVILFSIVPFVLFQLDRGIALFILTPLPIVAVIIFFSYWWLKKNYEKSQAALDRLSTWIQDALTPSTELKVYDALETQRKKSRDLGIQLQHAQVKVASLQGGIGPVLEGITGLGLVVFFLGGYTMDPGVCLAASRLLQKLTWPMQAIGMGISALFQGLGSQRRLRFSPTDVSRSYTESGSAEVPLGWGEGDRRVELFKGDRVLIDGKVGEGKSRFMKQLVGIQEPEFSIRLYGKTYGEQAESDWIKKFAYLEQEPFLSQGDLASILFSDDKELLVDMGLGELVWRESTGETDWGENGNRLSGGQRQRLALARALIRAQSDEVEIVVLDDPFSAVDGDTARVLKDLILRETKNKILIIVSHRVEEIAGLNEVFNKTMILKEGSTPC